MKARLDGPILRQSDVATICKFARFTYFDAMKEMGRRNFLQSTIIGAAGICMSSAAVTDSLATTLPPQPNGLSSALIARARAAFAKHDKRIWQREVMGIADFSAPSRIPRFHLLNLISGQTTPLLVAHGKGSDPGHSGWVQHFSNVPGSEATSSGSYLGGESYVGQHGLSRRLIGLDPENDQAENRAIVIHSAWYVSPQIAAEQGKIGRSQGCFAFTRDDLTQVLWKLGPGSLLYADKI